MLVTVLVSTSCGLTRGSSIAAYPELRPAELGSMRNVRVCDERTWFGSVPSADDLDLAARRGVTRVFDLRTPSTRGDELRVTAEALGLEYAAPELPEVPTEVTGEQLQAQEAKRRGSVQELRRDLAHESTADYQTEPHTGGYSSTFYGSGPRAMSMVWTRKGGRFGS